MSTGEFGSSYAQAYDDLYCDKDYGAEADLLEVIFRDFGDGRIHSVLDLGCGTGNHVVPLAQRGYHVTGVDVSADMIREARRKASTVPNAPSLVEADIRKLDLGQTFDAVLMMFAVLGYQTANESVVSALHAVRKHLRTGGLFVFDVWYGPAVMTIRPSDRVKVVPTPDGKVIRCAGGVLDVRHHLCRVRYQVWHLRADGSVQETEEEHAVRYFFPMELELCLSQAGLGLHTLRGFPDFARPADETTWNAVVVAG